MDSPCVYLVTWAQRCYLAFGNTSACVFLQIPHFEHAPSIQVPMRTRWIKALLVDPTLGQCTGDNHWMVRSVAGPTCFQQVMVVLRKRRPAWRKKKTLLEIRQHCSNSSR